jgi:WD40 repeat protein
LCVLPKGHLAFTTNLDHAIWLWPPIAGLLKGHTDRVTELCVRSDGHLASAAKDGTIRLWDGTAQAETARLDGNGGHNALCWLLDGRLASGATDGTIRLWDAAAEVEIARLEGHVGPVTALCMLRGNRLASAAVDRTIRIWDLRAGTEIARLEVDASDCGLRDNESKFQQLAMDPWRAP